MSKTELTHKREVYTFMNLIGDLGGVLELILGIMGLFLVPYNEHNFTLEAIEKYYTLKPIERGSSNNGHRVEFSSGDWWRLFFTE
jgi:hypothetical protein